MICWSISEVRFAWWNCRYQFHLLGNKQAPQKLTCFLLLLRYRVSRFLYDALLTQSPSFFWLSYELPCGNIQNSEAPSRFCMRSSLFIKIDSLYLSVQTILLPSSKLSNCEESKWRPVTLTDFDLHCNGFLHCHDFFTMQRRKKTN